MLTEHDSGDVDHGGAVGGAGERVCHGQEDRVAEAVVEEEVLVQEKDSYVGTEPGGDAAVRTEGDTVRGGEEEGFSIGGGGGVWRCSGDVDDCWCGGGGGVEPLIAHPPRRP